jgi:hypothetical protein
MYDKATVLKVSHSKYENNKSATNALQLNRAVGAWKTIHLSGADITPNNVATLRAFFVGLTCAFRIHAKVQSDKIGEATAEFKSHLEDIQPFAKGKKDGTSWKANISLKIGIKKILEECHTPLTGLLASPGAKVCGAKAKLEQACWTRHPRHEPQSSRAVPGTIWDGLRYSKSRF